MIMFNITNEMLSGTPEKNFDKAPIIFGTTTENPFISYGVMVLYDTNDGEGYRPSTELLKNLNDFTEEIGLRPSNIKYTRMFNRKDLDEHRLGKNTE